jgi:2'-5' RNA ligase
VADRLFLALWLPAEAAEDLGERVDRVAAASPDMMRWQPRERWHLTVSFLGDRDPGQRPGIAAAAAAAAADAGADRIRLAGSGHFGSALWVGVEHGPWLTGLTRRLNRELVPHDRRKRFHGHVTVARSRGRRMHRPSQAALADYVGPWWNPQRLALVESVTGPAPRYTTVDSWPLAASGTRGDARH